MFALRWTRLTREFDAAFRALAAARIAYEDQPRDPAAIAALGAARIRLDEARAAMRPRLARLVADYLQDQAETLLQFDDPHGVYAHCLCEIQ